MQKILYLFQFRCTLSLFLPAAHLVGATEKAIGGTSPITLAEAISQRDNHLAISVGGGPGNNFRGPVFGGGALD